MYKYVAACGLTCLATVIAAWAAEPYTGFLSGGSTTTLPTSSVTSTPPKMQGPIPPDQFRQQVKAAGEANRQRMADQLQQSTSQPSAPTYQAPAAPTTTTPAPSVNATASAPSAPTTPSSNAPTTNSANRAAPTSTTPSSTQPSSNSTQVYTGFGGGNNNAPASGGNSNSGGGWNIRY